MLEAEKQESEPKRINFREIIEHEEGIKQPESRFKNKQKQRPQSQNSIQQQEEI